ncbi:MAG: sigma-70 family RNA polymerase sigma factor [Planctomycetes bacterium]|nr:sigma-70 family RNA polymerase sigma factor [Planctomycetota bacterium]
MQGLERRQESPSRDEERTLAREVIRGDANALDRFQATFAPAVYRFVFFRVGGRREQAEEIVQETFLIALQGLRRFRFEASIHTWLCGIAKNLLLQERRRSYRERLAVALDSVDPELDAMLANLDETLPDEVLERAETQDLVTATLASLPLPYQEVLIAKYITSDRVEDIARRRGTSAKAVESTLTRARHAFRRAFEMIAGRLAGGRR